MYLDSDKSKELITKTTGKNDCVYAFFDVFPRKESLLLISATKAREMESEENISVHKEKGIELYLLLLPIRITNYVGKNNKQCYENN